MLLASFFSEILMGLGFMTFMFMVLIGAAVYLVAKAGHLPALTELFTKPASGERTPPGDPQTPAQKE